MTLPAYPSAINRFDTLGMQEQRLRTALFVCFCVFRFEKQPRSPCAREDEGVLGVQGFLDRCVLHISLKTAELSSDPSRRRRAQTERRGVRRRASANRAMWRGDWGKGDLIRTKFCFLMKTVLLFLCSRTWGATREVRSE